MVFIWFSLKCETKNGTGNISAQIDLSVFQYYFKQNICKKKSRNNFDLRNLKSKLKKREKKRMNRKPKQALHLK